MGAAGSATFATHLGFPWGLLRYEVQRGLLWKDLQVNRLGGSGRVR